MFESFLAYYSGAAIRTPSRLCRPGEFLLDGPDRVPLSLPGDTMTMALCAACLDPAGPNPAQYNRLIRQEIDRLWQDSAAEPSSTTAPSTKRPRPTPSEFLFWLLVEYLLFLNGQQTATQPPSAP